MFGRKIAIITIMVALLLPVLARVAWAAEMSVSDIDWFEEKQLLDKPLRKLEDNIVRLTDRRFTLRWGFFNQDIYTYASEGAVQGISGPRDVRSNFWVRRARLYLRGTIIDDRIQWYFAPELNPSEREVVTGVRQDPATAEITGLSKTTVTAGFIRDACMTLRFIPYMAITVGQTKTPFGLEGVESLGVNPTILRSFTTMYLHWPFLRDIGVWAAGGWKARQYPFSIDYNVCVVNGNGMNKTDNNSAKDFVGRIRVQPFVPGLTLAACGYYGTETLENTSVVLDPSSVGAKTTFIGASGLTLDKWKFNFYFDYYCPFIRGLNARGEYIRRELFGDVSKFFPGLTDATYAAQGGYGLIRYRFGPWEPLYRFEAFDPDINVSGDVLKVHTFGVNYYFIGWTRVAVNYQWVQNWDEIKPLVNGGRQFFLSRFRGWFPVNQNNLNIMFSLRF